MIVDWVRTKVPCISGIFAQLQPKYRLKLSNFLVGLQFGIVHAEVRVVVGMETRCVLLMRRVLFDFKGGGLDPRVRDPIIVALIEVFEVDVVAVGILISRFGGVIIYN